MDCRGDTGIGRVPVTPSETGPVMAEAIAALKAMRDRYKAQGKMVQARTVEHCIQAIMRLG